MCVSHPDRLPLGIAHDVGAARLSILLGYRLPSFLRAILLAAILLVVGVQIGLAASATWLLNPTDNSWGNRCNWTGDVMACGHFSSVAVPNGPGDTATFGASAITNINGGAELNSAVFAQAGYTMNGTFYFVGAGIV